MTKDFCETCPKVCVFTGLPSVNYPECGFSHRHEVIINIKGNRRAYLEAYRQRPEYKERQKAYSKAYRQRKKREKKN